MAKKSAINRNEHVKRLVKRFEAKRARLKALANDESKPLEERFEARLKLAEGRAFRGFGRGRFHGPNMPESTLHV